MHRPRAGADVIRLVLRRAVWSIPLLGVVSVQTFVLISLVPGNAAQAILGGDASAAQMSALRSQLGLDQPLWTQYGHWLGRAVHGNLGTSLVTGQSVTSILGSRLTVSLTLIIGGTLVASVLGVLLGIGAATRGGALGRLVEVGAVLGLAVPNFSAGGNPLGMLKVRQALEYAVNRPAIVKALYGKAGGAAATEEVAIPAEPSAWDPAVNTYYPYDPAKARQLLTQAGFPHGFTIKVEDQGDDAELTQAVIGYWNKIGVKANLTADTTVTAWISNVLSKKFPAMGFAYGGLPMYMEAVNFFEPTANIFNPFATDDPAITNLVKTATAAPAAQQIADFQQVQAAGVQQAWYVAVAPIPVGLLHSSNVTAPPINQGYYGNDTDVTPAS